MPYLDKILAGASDRQAKEMDYMKGGLSNRGVLNSTPGFDRIAELGRGHDASNAQIALGGLQAIAPNMQTAMNSNYTQDMGVDQNAYNQWMGSNRLQSDLDWRQDQSNNQSMQLLLQALGTGGGGGNVPGYTVPAGGASTLDSLGNIIGSGPPAGGWSSLLPFL